MGRGKAGLLLTPLALGIILETWLGHSVVSMGVDTGRLGQVGGGSQVCSVHTGRTGAPDDPVRSLERPTHAPNGAGPGARGVDAFSNDDSGMAQWLGPTADWPGQSKKNSCTHIPPRHTHGVSRNSRPSHDALPTPGPLKL